MATRKAELQIGISGEKEYKEAISEINKGNQVLNSEMQLLQERFKGNEGSMEALTAKSDLLQRQLQQQKDKVSTLQDALKNAGEQYGVADKRTQSWEIQLNNAEKEQLKLERAIKETTDAMEGSEDATDEAAAAIDNYSDSTKDAGDKTSIFAGVLKADLVHDAIHAAIDGLRQLGEMAIEFGKTVIEKYGELEQNLGGSEAVFGEYAAEIQRISVSSYASIGQSQSEYLAAANKIGALLQGSGIETKRSMELSTQAIQRAADTASVMGIDTSAALEAITGAAKGNYTMMDNLGVKMDATTLKSYALAQGMSKTWEEMSNAEKAEVAMQYFFEQTEKYAGNFERESRETISGSIGMLQASVDSWIAGLGDSEADIGVLTGNVIDAFGAVVENTVPIVENVIESVPEIYETVLSTIEQKDPELAQKLRDFVDPFKTLLTELFRLGENIIPVVVPALESVLGVIQPLAGWLGTAVGWLADFVGYLGQITPEGVQQTMADYSDFDWGTGGVYDWNAAGDYNWRGGLTWVGEAGPEVVELPRGSRIYSAQESGLLAANSGTDTSRLEALLERSVVLQERIAGEFSALRVKRRMA